jgi:pimeloyl-ACP methyl ester carboxylesterase
VALFAVLFALDIRMQDEGARGIIDFELAGNRDHAQRILAAWGPDGRSAARASLWIDYLYLVAYGGFVALAVAALRDRARAAGWDRTARAGALLVTFPLLAAAFDACEDVFLLLTIGGHGGRAAPVLASGFAGCKFLLITVALAFVLVVLARRFWTRFPRARWPVAGALAALVTAVTVVGIVAIRATDPASADHGGRVIRLPGPDLHVIDEGPRSRDALVLLHGYGASTAWWQASGRILARHHRVIRVDLVGFGDSEKPRDGYWIDRQAQQVLAALRVLRVGRAVVAAHSMGGDVAASMVQQDRPLIRGVALLGTPPGDGYVDGSLGDLLTQARALGAAMFKLAPDAFLRRLLEAGVSNGTKIPDRFVADLRGSTFSALRSSGDAIAAFLDHSPPGKLLAASHRPLLVIFGTRDKIVDPLRAPAAWATVPGARVVRLPGIGHSPQIEDPPRTAALIGAFAARVLRAPAGPRSSPRRRARTR